MASSESVGNYAGKWYRSVFRPKAHILFLSLIALMALPLILVLGGRGKPVTVVGEMGDKVLFDTGGGAAPQGWLGDTFGDDNSVGDVVDDFVDVQRVEIPETHYVLVPKFHEMQNATHILNEEAAVFSSLKVDFDHYREEVKGVGNGKLPTDGLCKLPWTNKSVLRCDAEFSFELLDQAFKAEFGHDIDITDSYRDFETQVEVRDKLGKIAAVPGYSNHGNGIALDLGSNIPDPDSPEHKWMEENAARFHWVNPDWARPGNKNFKKNEPWHWEYHYNPNDDIV